MQTLVLRTTLNARLGVLDDPRIPPSLCSQKVRLVLVEKGVPYHNHWVDIG